LPAAPVAARVAPSLLGELSADALAALRTLALRFSAPAIFFGAIFIPTPNSGGVTEGELPELPGVRFKLDQPAGTVKLFAKGSDGSDTIVNGRQGPGGIFVDVKTGRPIGRILNGMVLFDSDAVAVALGDTGDDHAGADAGTEAKEHEPRLCPKAEPDTKHGSKTRAIDYEDEVHERVNPDPKKRVPSEFGIWMIDPLTGHNVIFEDCFQDHGDLVDGDMQRGDFVDAKGPGYADLLRDDFQKTRGAMVDLVRRAGAQTRAAGTAGARVKWYFAEKAAADIVRKRFDDEDFSDRITIGHMPPTKRRPK
jgi:hypothetical protein